MSLKNYKISFCIVSMNRLHHIKETLLPNILDNEDYSDLEFILVDYNSGDELEAFIKETMQKYIDSGKLVYYKTLKPESFNRSHSRNLAFKLATGDIICNIDADNFTGKGFASYINSEFNAHENVFITTIGHAFENDVLGRICVKQEDFYKVRGFDERMVDYGFEDYDFVNRLEMTGVKKHLFQPNEIFFNAILHDKKERISNESVLKNLHGVFVNYLSPASTDVLLLFNNNEFKRHVYVDHQTFVYPGPLTEVQKSQLGYQYSFLEESSRKGTWNEKENGIILTDTEMTDIFLSKEIWGYSGSLNDKFYQITDTDLIMDFVMTYSTILNRLIMAKNVLKGNAVVNEPHFGKDELYKNFSAQCLELN